MHFTELQGKMRKFMWVQHEDIREHTNININININIITYDVFPIEDLIYFPR